MNDALKAKSLLNDDCIRQASAQLEEMEEVHEDQESILVDFYKLCFTYYQLTNNRDFTSHNYKIKMRNVLCYNGWCSLKCRKGSRRFLSLQFYLNFNQPNLDKVKLGENWSRHILNLIYDLKAAIAEATSNRKITNENKKTELESIRKALT